MKTLYVLVGGNGSGKSSFYDQMLKPEEILFVNADLIAKNLSPDNPEALSYKAASLAESKRYQLIDEGVSFCFETVFSHPSKVDFIAHAKGHGYYVVLILIHLFNDALNQGRVSSRVIRGGHDVPADKIVDRIPRTLKNVSATIPLSDEFYIFDNSSRTDPFKRVYSVAEGVRSDIPEKYSSFVQGLLNPALPGQ